MQKGRNLFQTYKIIEGRRPKWICLIEFDGENNNNKRLEKKEDEVEGKLEVLKVNRNKWNIK